MPISTSIPDVYSVGKWVMFSVVLDGARVVSWFSRHTFGRYVVVESLGVVGMPLIP